VSDGADRKQRWAARLARRHTRGKRPAPKPRAPREKREPRVLKAYPTLANEILEGLVGTVRPMRAPSPALIMAAAALAARKARTEP
jgi:hypothetical protein